MNIYIDIHEYFFPFSPLMGRPPVVVMYLLLIENNQCSFCLKKDALELIIIIKGKDQCNEKIIVCGTTSKR